MNISKTASAPKAARPQAAAPQAPVDSPEPQEPQERYSPSALGVLNVAYHAPGISFTPLLNIRDSAGCIRDQNKVERASRILGGMTLGAVGGAIVGAFTGSPMTGLAVGATGGLGLSTASVLFDLATDCKYRGGKVHHEEMHRSMWGKDDATGVELGKVVRRSYEIGITNKYLEGQEMEKKLIEGAQSTFSFAKGLLAMPAE